MGLEPKKSYSIGMGLDSLQGNQPVFHKWFIPKLGQPSPSKWLNFMAEINGGDPN